jgi:anti-sigma regulatory factor (Ser/Thr protein kinase)
MDVIHSGESHIIFSFGRMRDNSIFPNTAVPISAFLHNLVVSHGISFELEEQGRSVEQTHIFTPLPIGNNEIINSPMGKVWIFKNSEEVFLLQTKIMDWITRSQVFEHKGIIDAIEWCLYEVMDNVIQHSESSCGYIMAQMHGAAQKQLVFCIADTGIGIFASLTSSGKYHPDNAYDAITLALKKGVTRTQNQQGNGLWGLERIIESNEGTLEISTSEARIRIDGDGRVSKEGGTWLNYDRGSTTVDFQLHLDRPISLQQALESDGHESVRYINAEVSGGGKMVYMLKDSTLGFGTREAGVSTRNEVLNLMQQNDVSVIIDFNGIGVISSSFADEMVGKLYAEFGPVQFMQHFELKNMGATVQAIMNKAIEERLVQTNYAKYVNEDNRTALRDDSPVPPENEGVLD